MPPLTVGFTSEALADIAKIVQESIDRFGVQQAARYNAAIRASCDRVGEYPHIGSVQPDLPSVVAYPSGTHRIYYSIESTHVLILRILHQRVRLSDAD